MLIVCASTAIAQNSNFTEFNIEDGLIMSQIESITQDNKGNLWVGTIGGLSKYDGTSFVNYTQKEGLAEDWVTICHFNKTSNTLWLGHRGGGISYLKGDSSNFTDPMLEEFTRYGLVRDLLEIEGNLWIAVENVGLVQYNIEAKTAQLIQGIEAKHLSTLFLDQNKMLWVGTEDGTFIVNTTNSAVIVTPANTNLEGSPAEDIIGAMGNEVWIATMNGIQRHKLPSSEKDYATSLSEESNLQVLTTADGLTSNQVHTLFEDDQHYVWIGTQKNGVLQYVPNQFNNATAAFTKGALTIFSNKFEMRYYQANTFFQDRESNVWMGTEFGLLKYMGELFKIYDQHDNLINNLVWSILEDRKGNMWFGTSEGVSRFTFPSVKGKVQYHNPQSFNLTTADGLPENIVISMHQTSDNNIWMGTEHSGVFSIDESGNVQQKFTTNDGLADSKAYSITEDKEGNIWVGTNGGLSVIASDNSIKTYTKADGLGGDKVYKVFCDSKGRIWCGILGGDLTVYENGTFTTFGEKRVFRKSLSPV